MSYIESGKHFKFFLENYEDIEAMMEVVTHVKKKLPDMLNSIVIEAIQGLKSSYFDEKGIGCNQDDKSIYLSFSDLEYEGDEVTELFIVFYTNRTWDSLFKYDVAFFPRLELVLNTGEVESKKEKNRLALAWIEKFEEIENELDKHNIKINPECEFENRGRDDEISLLYYPLNNEISINALKDKDMLFKDIQEAVMKFSIKIFSVLSE
jgi:hypothetical protein